MTLGIGEGLELGTVDGVVLADVYIVSVLGDIEVGAVGNVGEGLVCGGSHCNCVAVDLCFLISLLSPLTGDYVSCLLVLHEVHGDSRELLGSAALEEQYLVVIRNVHDVADILLGFLDDGVVCL